MNDRPILECKNIYKRFTQGSLNVEVLKDVSMTVSVGQNVAIMGASGSGKSTLLHLLGGLDAPNKVIIILDGIDINKLNTKQISGLRNHALGFVYQFHHLLGEFTVLENISMPLLIGGENIRTAKEKAKQILVRVGLGERLPHKPGELSGGERQRAAIARALVTMPKCVLADEPTGNLDSKTANRIYDLMLELNQEFKISFLIVTHDQNLAERLDRVLHLEDGRFVV